MPIVERDLITAETVDLSTLNGAELPALAALAALEQQAVMVYERAAMWYGLGEFTNEINVLRLLLTTIEELGRLERDFYRVR